MSLWSSLLSDPGAPAWVQAVGSVLAILVTMGLAAWQRSSSFRDAQVHEARREKEYLKRLIAALKAEINTAMETMALQQSGIQKTLEALNAARANGSTIKTDPIQPGSMVMTDAIIYRQIAAELGRFPTDLIQSVIQFYAGASLLARLADQAPTAQLALEVAQNLAPRLRMLAAMLIKKLENFETSGFAAGAEIGPTPAEVREFAARQGYPLDQVARERGLQL